MTTGAQVTPIVQLCQSISKMESKFAQALPKGMSAERFVRVATNAIQMHPQKDKLLNADRTSLYNACLKAASDGLELDGRESALIVFNSKQGNDWVSQAQYIPMVQGLVKLARNSGEIASITSEVVYENDEFEFYEDYEGSKFKHQINWKGERGNPILVWAKIKLVNGETIIRALTRKRIEQIASVGKNGGQYSPTEGKHFEEWWRKAAIKNVLKYAPKSTYLESALDNDDKAESGEFLDVSAPQVEPTKSERKTKTSQIVTEQAEVGESISQPDMPPHDAQTGEILDVEYDEIPV